MRIKTKRFSIAFCIVTVIFSLIAAMLFMQSSNSKNVIGASANLAVTYEEGSGENSGKYGLSVTLPAGYEGTVQYWIKTKVADDGGLDVNNQTLWKLVKTSANTSAVWFELDKNDLFDSKNVNVLARIRGSIDITEISGVYNVDELGRLKINAVQVGEELYSGKLLYAQNVGSIKFDTYTSIEGATYSIRLKGHDTVLDSGSATNDNNKLLTVDTSEFTAGEYVFEITVEKDGQIDLTDITVYVYDAFDADTTPIITGMDYDKSGNTITYKVAVEYANNEKIDYISDADFWNEFYMSFVSDGYKDSITPSITHLGGKVVSIDFELPYNGTGVYRVQSYISRKSISGNDDTIIRFYDNGIKPSILTRTDTNGNSIDRNQQISITYAGSIDGDSTDIEYAFYREDASGWLMIQSYKSAAENGNILNWTPTKSGKYIIQTRIRKTSTVASATYETATDEVFTVGANELLKGSLDISIKDMDNDPIAKKGFVAGRPYMISAEYVNGGGESYQADELLYMYTLSNANTGLIYLNNYTPDGNLIFVPNKLDEYIITARVIQTGTYGYMEQSQALTVDVLSTGALPKVNLMSENIDIDLQEDVARITQANLALPSQIIGEVEEVRVGENIISFTQSGSDGEKVIDIAVPNKSGIPYGENTLTVITSEAEYTLKITVASMVIKDKARLNKLATTSANLGGTRGGFNYWDGYYVLGDNINYKNNDGSNGVFAKFCGWQENSGNPFTNNTGFVGTFDGRGYIIDGMTIASEVTGMFSSTGTTAVIKNIAFINALYAGKSGGFLAYTHTGLIENIFISGRMEPTATSGNAMFTSDSLAGNNPVRNSIVYFEQNPQLNGNSLLNVRNVDSVFENLFAVGAQGALYTQDYGNPKSSVKGFETVNEFKTFVSQNSLSGEDLGSMWTLSNGVIAPARLSGYLNTLSGINTSIANIGEQTQLTANMSGLVYSIDGNAPEGTTLSSEGLLTVGSTVSNGTEVNVIAVYPYTGKTFTKTIVCEGIGVNYDGTYSDGAYFDIELDRNASQTTVQVDVTDFEGYSSWQATDSIEMFVANNNFAINSYENGILTLDKAALKNLGYGVKTITLEIKTNDSPSKLRYRYTVKVALVSMAIANADDLDNMLTVSHALATPSIKKPTMLTYNGYFVLSNNFAYGDESYNRTYTKAPFSWANTDWPQTTYAGFGGVLDGRGFIIDRFKTGGGIGALIGYTNPDSIIRNIGFTNARNNSDGAGLIAYVHTGAIENVYISGSMLNVGEGRKAMISMFGGWYQRDGAWMQPVVKNCVVHFDDSQTTPLGTEQAALNYANYPLCTNLASIGIKAPLSIALTDAAYGARPLEASVKGYDDVAEFSANKAEINAWDTNAFEAKSDGLYFFNNKVLSF